MKEINIARAIINNRKAKSLTQDDLAHFIGVSKASVSKWETGQSYPDIVLLPQLAAYFGISIDDLMGYEPQMTDADIRKLYQELAAEFATKPFDDVTNRCREITKKYYSCFPLLLQIGALYLNYGCANAGHLDGEQNPDILAEAKELFIRVKDYSDDLDLKHLALNLIATCELLQGNADQVISIFKDAKKHSTTANDILLAQAYMMTGKVTEAKTTLQGSIYDGIMELISYIAPYLNICMDDPTHFDEVCRRTTELIKLFNVKELYPTGILSFYLVAAQGYAASENVEQALNMLEEYTGIVTGNIFPLVLLKKDDFFNLVDVSTDNLPWGTSELPRDEKSIKQSMVDAILPNPAFAALADEARFKLITGKLSNLKN